MSRDFDKYDFLYDIKLTSRTLTFRLYIVYTSYAKTLTVTIAVMVTVTATVTATATTIGRIVTNLKRTNAIIKFSKHKNN